jgi:DNA-directed RNA polymerase specialized sigma24 family protein
MWATQCQASRASGESCEDLADRALARAWMALTPERFSNFPSLSTLLAYLRRCVTATAIDAARTRMVQDRLAQQADRTNLLSIEQIVLARLDNTELWQIVAPLAKTEAERVVLVERFVQALPPRTILARHPTLFADVMAVYAVIRNLCERLRRSPELRRLYDDRWAA